MSKIKVKNLSNQVVTEVVLHHDMNPGINTINNRGFATLNGELVEVVRRGPRFTRIRTNLNFNASTILVFTSELAHYQYLCD